MGQEIFYCGGCATRLRSGDLEAKHAFRIGSQVLCRRCAPPDAATAAAETFIDEMPAVPRRPPSSPSNKPVELSKGTRRVPSRPASRAPLGLILGGVASGVVLLALVAAVLSRSGPAPGPPAPRVQAPAPAPPPLLPRPVEVRRPEPPPRPSRPEPAPRTAEEDLRELDEQLQALVGRGEHVSALMILDAARKRREGDTWKGEIDRRYRDIDQARPKAKADVEKPAPPPPPPPRAPKAELPASSAPVAWWRLLEGKGSAAEDSAGTIRGILAEGAAWNTSPPALRLDGKKGHVRLGTDLVLLREASSCTLAAWIHPEGVATGAKEYNVIAAFSIHSPGAAKNVSRLTLELAQGGRVRVLARTTDAQPSASVITEGDPVAKGRWQHVAATLDFGKNEIRVYLDGRPAAVKGTVKFLSPTMPSTPISTAAIGGEDDGSGNFFHGLLSDIRLYAQPLPPDRIAELAALSPALRSERVSEGLLALYAFSEGGGNRLRDLSGAGDPLDLQIADPAAVRWQGRRGLLFSSPTIAASDAPASKIITACKASDEITLEAWLIPADARQEGPARVVTLSKDISQRDFTLGQEADQWEARLRTTSTSANGQPAVFSEAGTAGIKLTHVVYTRSSSGETRFYVDGSARGVGTVPGSFAKWDKSFRLAIGNEHTLQRPWLGEFRLVAIYARALSAAEILQNARVLPD